MPLDLLGDGTGLAGTLYWAQWNRALGFLGCSKPSGWLGHKKWTCWDTAPGLLRHSTGFAGPWCSNCWGTMLGLLGRSPGFAGTQPEPSCVLAAVPGGVHPGWAMGTMGGSCPSIPSQNLPLSCPQLSPPSTQRPLTPHSLFSRPQSSPCSQESLDEGWS